MTERTKLSAKQIGDDLFETFRISFDGAREKAGFNRLVRTSRIECRLNGIIIPRADFLALQRATH